MDYLGEAIALGINSLILGACLRQYFKNSHAVQMIQVNLYKKYLTVPFVNRYFYRVLRYWR